MKLKPLNINLKENYKTVRSNYEIKDKRKKKVLQE
jgi:hypothetical protein